MAQSKKNPKRKKKVQNFKQKAKKMSEQQKTPKTHLVPQTEWNSKDVLELRGDLLEALEQLFVQTYEHLSAANSTFSKAGQVIQMIMSNNIKNGKIKLTYKWNNGEDATPEDVAEFEAQMKQIREHQQNQAKQQQQLANAAKTGLVGPDGEPIGTTQDLSEPEDSDLVTDEPSEEVKSEE